MLIPKNIYHRFIKWRGIVSYWIAKTYKLSDEEPKILGWTADQLRDFMAMYYRWVSDPAFGVLDHIQPIKHMNWQLFKKGVIKGDCDDLATYTAYLALRAFQKSKVAWRINIAPRNFEMGHVICLIHTTDGWRWGSNQQLSDGYFNTWEEALVDFIGEEVVTWDSELIRLDNLL